jgi:hypothetical protein
MQANLFSYANVFKFEIHGRPNLEIGKVLNFQDRSGVSYNGVIYEMDSEVGDGYTQLVTVKVVPNFDGYFIWGTSTWGSGHTWF